MANKFNTDASSFALKSSAPVPKKVFRQRCCQGLCANASTFSERERFNLLVTIFTQLCAEGGSPIEVIKRRVFLAIDLVPDRDNVCDHRRVLYVRLADGLARAGGHEAIQWLEWMTAVAVEPVTEGIVGTVIQLQREEYKAPYTQQPSVPFNGRVPPIAGISGLELAADISKRSCSITLHRLSVQRYWTGTARFDTYFVTALSTCNKQLIELKI